MPCNKDPRAPHGFDRTASHTQDRYVCECEGWVAPDDVWTSDVAKLRAELAAAQRELAAWRKAADEMDNRYPNEWCSTSEVMTARVAELLAQEGVK